jgi:hypothetical protein
MHRIEQIEDEHELNPAAEAGYGTGHQGLAVMEDGAGSTN